MFSEKNLFICICLVEVCFSKSQFSSLPQQDGWSQNHFLTPVSTLERDRFKSQPTLPTSTIQMSPVNHPGRLLPTTLRANRHRRAILLEPLAGMCPLLSAAASAMSSPAMLGVKDRRDTVRDYQRAQSTMQFYNYQGESGVHKKQFTGKLKF